MTEEEISNDRVAELFKSASVTDIKFHPGAIYFHLSTGVLTLWKGDYDNSDSWDWTPSE